jgi:hypothetical protein
MSRDKYTVIYQTTDDEVHFRYLNLPEGDNIHQFCREVFRNGERINLIFYGYCQSVRET